MSDRARADEQPLPSILVAGPGKTGTTGVYSAVKRAVHARSDAYACLFEPASSDPFVALGRYQPQRPILTKVMVRRLDDGIVRYPDFAKRVMTVRDPRDVVVSRLLFRPLIRSVVGEISDTSLDTFLDALREKEQYPSSWSVRRLHGLADRLGIRKSAFGPMIADLQRSARIIDVEQFFVQRYEDFVDGRLGPLSDYLGFPVENTSAGGGTWLSHIPRSMGSGAWKHWFMPDDVEFFGDMFSPYLTRFGYDDVALAADPHIDPATSSEYIRRQLADRRAQVEHRYTRSWSVADTTQPAQVEQLRQMAEDGDAEAALRLALVIDAGAAGERADRQAAVAAAREGAVRGHAGAMDLLSTWLLSTGHHDAVLEGRMWAREADAWRELAALRAAAGAAVSRQDVRDARREVKRLRRSPEYRLGVRLRPLLTLRRWLLSAARRLRP